MTFDENKLVRQFQQGGAEAFDTLYRLYGERIYRFCYRLCGRAADAEDLTQEVFVAAFQGMTRFEGRATLATWLYRIALYQWRRRQATYPAHALLTEETLGDAQGADMAALSIDNVLLAQALATLPPDLYEAFLLVKMEGLTYREAAVALDAPQGTIQYRVHEAMMRLRERLQNAEAEPEATAGQILPPQKPPPQTMQTQTAQVQTVQTQSIQAQSAQAQDSRRELKDFQEQTSHAM